MTKKLSRFTFIIITILGLLFTSSPAFAGNRFKEEGKAAVKDDVKLKGFILATYDGTRWAVVDNGHEIKVYFDKGTCRIRDLNHNKEGLEIKTETPAGGISIIRIEEIKPDTRQRVSVIPAEVGVLDELVKRFPQER